MRKFICAALCLLAFQVNSYSHGGQYRGPGDVVPPGGGRSPGGPSTPNRPTGPTAPTTPNGPSNPTPPGIPNGPVGPNGPSGGPRTGIPLELSLDTWTFWWEFNKDRFLNLKNSINGSAPTTDSDEFYIGIKKSVRDSVLISREVVKASIYPNILQVLENRSERQVDEISSALIALGKIGVDLEQSISIISRFLSDKNQEIKETAALALGILSDPLSVKSLTDLAIDNPIGRDLVDEREVDYRTRSFAIYGLGLVAYKLKDSQYADLRKDITSTLLSILKEDTSAAKDIKIACITALGLVPRDPDLRTIILNRLVPILQDTKTKNIDLIRAHIPTAIARQVGVEHLDSMIKMLANKDESQFVRQSIILAIGHMSPFVQNVNKLEELSKLIINVQKNGFTHQERYFANIVLGQIGTDICVEHLLNQISNGKQLEKPWAAIGLGVYGFNKDKVNNTVGEALRFVFIREKNPDTVSAYAIALGLIGYQPAEEVILREYVRTNQEDTKGYLGISLGLLVARNAQEQIAKDIPLSTRKPLQLQQLSIALALLGHKDIVNMLSVIISQSRTTAVYAAAAQAMGFIGDQRSIKPLVNVVTNMSISGEARAFALVALGIVGAQEELPWNTKISENMNYRASVTTLVGGTTGVLDIL